MKLGYTYYKITSPEILKLFEAYMKERRAILRRFKKFAEEVGADTRHFIVNRSNNYFTVKGLKFKQHPGPGWTGDNQEGWRPYKKSPLYKKFKEIGHVDTKEIVAALKFRPFFHDGYFYDFSFGYINKPKIAVFSIPKFNRDACKQDKSLVYKAPRGTCTKISAEQYAKWFDGVEG